MVRIENLSKERLARHIADYIKKTFKQMGSRTNCELDIRLNNWGSRLNGKWHWSRTEIEFDNTIYEYKDKQVDDVAFIRILNDAVALSNVRCKVYNQTYGDGYWTPQETRFERVEIYAKPCKEFITLYKMLEKYANKSLGETEVFYARVCGKRSSWSECGTRKYLCYDAKQCQAIIDTIRKYRTSKDSFGFDVEDCFSHGDDYDYEIAQHQESEWYGSNQAKLHIIIKTPSGRVKADYKFGV
jgi:hypothetical protein